MMVSITVVVDQVLKLKMINNALKNCDKVSPEHCKNAYVKIYPLKKFSAKIYPISDGVFDVRLFDGEFGLENENSGNGEHLFSGISYIQVLILNMNAPTLIKFAKIQKYFTLSAVILLASTYFFK